MLADMPDELRGRCSERQDPDRATPWRWWGLGRSDSQRSSPRSCSRRARSWRSTSADSRLDAAKLFGAGVLVNNERDDAVERIREITGGLGVDTTIEAVGVPEVSSCERGLVRPGGVVANVGVHGKPATLHLEDLWIKGVTVTRDSSTPTRLQRSSSSSDPGSSTSAKLLPTDTSMDGFPRRLRHLLAGGRDGSIEGRDLANVRASDRRGLEARDESPLTCRTRGSAGSLRPSSARGRVLRGGDDGRPRYEMPDGFGRRQRSLDPLTVRPAPSGTPR